MLTITLNILPIVLGVIVLSLCFTEYTRRRRRKDRGIVALSAVASLILVITKSAWLFVNISTDSDAMVSLFSFVWSIYHSLLMVILIMFVSPKRNYNKDCHYDS